MSNATHSIRGLLFIVSNLAITAGYVFMAFGVIPRIAVKLKRTMIGGVGFFTLCGLHHADNVFHFIFQGNEKIGYVYPELHMLLIDVPQAVCVWMFVTGLYIELVRWGPWGKDEPGWDGTERRAD